MREPPGPCGAGRLRCAYVFVAECLCLRVCLRVGAGGRRPAREIATRELRSEWSISKPGQALPPPTGTAAWPSSGSCGTTPIPATMSGLDHSRINKPSTTCAHAQWCNACPWGGVRIRGRAPVSSTPVGPLRMMVLGASARCPAAAHQHRGQAPQASRRPPIGRGVCVMPGQAPQAPRRPRSVGLVVCVLTGSAAAHLRGGQVLQPLRRPPHRQGLVCWCVVRRSVISHAIRRPHCAGLCQFVMLRHLCL